MLRFALTVVVLGLSLGLVSSVTADEKKETKEKTIKGTITCAKCDLGVADKCHTVIKAKSGDKEIVYWFDTASNGKYHKEICSSGKEGTVVGTVSEKDGKHSVKATKVTFKK